MKSFEQKEQPFSVFVCACMFKNGYECLRVHMYTQLSVFLEGDFTGIYKVPLGSHPMMHFPFEPLLSTLFT